MLNFISSEIFKLRHKLRSWLGPLLIMILVLIAFPLSIDISQYDLNKFFFSVIVVALLMISFLATESIFSEDYEDGSLEQLHLEEKDFLQSCACQDYHLCFSYRLPYGIDRFCIFHC